MSNAQNWILVLRESTECLIIIHHPLGAKAS